MSFHLGLERDSTRYSRSVDDDRFAATPTIDLHGYTYLLRQKKRLMRMPGIIFANKAQPPEIFQQRISVFFGKISPLKKNACASRKRHRIFGNQGVLWLFHMAMKPAVLYGTIDFPMKNDQELGWFFLGVPDFGTSLSHRVFRHKYKTTSKKISNWMVQHFQKNCW